MKIPTVRTGDIIFFMTPFSIKWTLVDILLVALGYIALMFHNDVYMIKLAVKLLSFIACLKFASLKDYESITFLSAAIRFFTKSKPNHVGVAVVNNGVPMINEALGKGIVSTPFKDRAKNIIAIKRPLRNVDNKFYAIEADSFLGKTPYDFLGLLWHQLVLSVTGRWVGPSNIDKAKKKFYCYEYAAYMNRRDYPNWLKVNVKEFYESKWMTPIYKK